MKNRFLIFIAYIPLTNTVMQMQSGILELFATENEVEYQNPT